MGAEPPARPSILCAGKRSPAYLLPLEATQIDRPLMSHSRASIVARAGLPIGALSLSLCPSSDRTLGCHSQPAAPRAHGSNKLARFGTERRQTRIKFRAPQPPAQIQPFQPTLSDSSMDGASKR